MNPLPRSDAWHETRRPAGEADNREAGPKLWCMSTEYLPSFPLSENEEASDVDENADAHWLTDALRGAVFPLERRQLVRVAQENGATAEHVSLLSQLPDAAVHNAADVEMALAPLGTGA